MVFDADASMPPMPHCRIASFIRCFRLIFHAISLLPPLDSQQSHAAITRCLRQMLDVSPRSADTARYSAMLTRLRPYMRDAAFTR